MNGIQRRARAWVREQAELGERTDNREGLSEYRIDAAEQAFEAGWQAGVKFEIANLDARLTKIEVKIAADADRTQVPS